ncbi:uncharacterized protein LOC135110104 [Scylla paramamosain]|uniref:uncharacterized protein LOC135110104 n=1 Tax=Scylla paramamosain TaxID=85552 RepID=UPI0030836FD7
MTGRSREVVNVMKRRKINILCVQETRWRGNKARELGDGYKLIYSGANKEGRGGVGVVSDAEWKKHIVNVNRCSDRVMNIKLMYGKVTINIITVYAPQVGCSIEEKEDFWEQMDVQITGIGKEERIILGGDLNGHVGRNKNAIERIHGGWGVGERNEEDENVVDFAVAFDRVINGESVAPQHWLIVIDFEMKEERKGRQQRTSRIKWWRLNDEELKAEFKIKVLDRMVEAEDPDTWWTTNSRHIRIMWENIRQGPLVG